MRIPLGYGKTEIDFEYDPDQFQILGTEDSLIPLSDRQIGEKLDNPIGKNFEETIKPGETILIVVPDATREIGCGQIINLLVRRLIANGTMPFSINIIFATGLHRKVTEAEKSSILTPFIFQRIKTLDHDAKDLMQFMRLGETTGGIPVELNRKLTEYDHIILIGGINFHYFAGFTGGRKLICPGLASARTISETHKLAFDFERKTRRAGVGIARLAGNPVHEAFVEAVSMAPPSFSINTIVNKRGKIIDLVAGDYRTSHEKACSAYAQANTIRISEKRDVVVVSCGGFPYDLNMIQAHKALEAAANACRDGGTIIFLAKCENGLGRDDFVDWFVSENSKKLAERLCEHYQVNGQTAWSLLKKAEKFEIKIFTYLPKETTEKMRMIKIEDISKEITDSKGGYILPYGAKIKIEID